MIYSSEYIFILYFSLAFKMPLPWLSHQVTRRCNDKTLGKIHKSDLFEDERYIFDPSLLRLQNAPSPYPFRGSQWGGGFYGYRLKFCLFYGYQLIFFSYG